jgi:putative sigma-54 modulation protein
LKIVIAGRHADVTDSMKAYAREKVEKLRKFFDRATLARVAMDRERDVFRAEILFEVPRGVSLVGKAEAPDMFAACDLAEQKLAGQLRRYKQRLQDHRGPRMQGAEVAESAAATGADTTGDESVTYEDVIDRMRRGE